MMKVECYLMGSFVAPKPSWLSDEIPMTPWSVSKSGGAWGQCSAELNSSKSSEMLYVQETEILTRFSLPTFPIFSLNRLIRPVITIPNYWLEKKCQESNVTWTCKVVTMWWGSFQVNHFKISPNALCFINPSIKLLWLGMSLDKDRCSTVKVWITLNVSYDERVLSYLPLCWIDSYSYRAKDQIYATFCI